MPPLALMPGVRLETAVALALALASTTLVSVSYVREHDAVGTLPALSLRRPVQSLRLLLGSRTWLTGFAMESGGFILYVTALALAPLALVQSVAAGGIGILAVASARLSHAAFALAAILGCLLGTSLLQIGYQRGAALTIAGIATLLTNALPIAAGPVLLNETLPKGAPGVLRILAFATVIAGAIILARPQRSIA